jgi:hypothetical protein
MNDVVCIAPLLSLRQPRHVVKDHSARRAHGLQLIFVSRLYNAACRRLQVEATASTSLVLVEGTGGDESATFCVDARPAFLATTFFGGVFLLPACGPFFAADVDFFAVALLPAEAFADFAGAFFAAPFFAATVTAAFFAAAFFAVTAFGGLSLPPAGVDAAPLIRNFVLSFAPASQLGAFAWPLNSAPLLGSRYFAG